MTSSPPLAPIRDYMSTNLVSPTSSYRQQLRRRSSSYSSNHDRSSPTSTRSKHRYSTASTYSNDLQQHAEEYDAGDTGTGMGMGNLADELDMLDDEEEYDYTDMTGDAPVDELLLEGLDEPADGVRDSGIDVSYAARKSKPQPRNFSKPFVKTGKPPDTAREADERFSEELEDSMAAIQRMAQYADATEDPLVPRVVALLRDLGNQSTLETLIQRMNTSTNSMASHLAKETRALQILSTSLYSPFLYANPLDLDALEEAMPLTEDLLTSLPFPDPSAHAGLQKLVRETSTTVSNLTQITDTLQMGKQCTNAAARHLRSSQTVVEDMRRERERADVAAASLAESGWHSKFEQRWCKRECDDVMSGFEDVCSALRASLVAACAS